MESNQGFEDWVVRFSADIAHLFPDSFIKQAFFEVEFLPDVVQKDNNQAEHNLAIWTYVNRICTLERVKQGRDYLAFFKQDLNSIESSYGVSPAVVIAIWGIETSYGQTRGDYKILSTLATLAFDGRRQDFFESELTAALTILQSKLVKMEKFLGSWAGAMGHTQFMPSSYLNHAVDYDRDGIADIWSENPIDALASTSAYLKKNGWLRAVPWGKQVFFNDSLDYALAEPRIKNKVSKWEKIGINCGIQNKGLIGSIIIPSGAAGPKFLTTKNFDVIKTYNRSTAYALGVALLSDLIDGQEPPNLSWPGHEYTLTRSEISELQQLLTDRGCDTRGNDGLIGPNTEIAIRKFQHENNMTKDGFHSILLLNILRA
jgi:membrane-bound lytic murein transglycosylase B